MRFGKFMITTVFLTLLCIPAAFSDEQKDEDFAVPAFSDFPQLTGIMPIQTNQMIGVRTFEEGPNPLPEISQLRWFDINRDLKLNDFDVEQFQKIIESLKGDQLTGLQLTIRFRGEQKNQKESFPVLYDLDRDGMFTSYDVDYFTEMINKLDDGALRGNELVQKYRLQIFPQKR